MCHKKGTLTALLRFSKEEKWDFFVNTGKVALEEIKSSQSLKKLIDKKRILFLNLEFYGINGANIGNKTK